MPILTKALGFRSYQQEILENQSHELTKKKKKKKKKKKHCNFMYEHYVPRCALYGSKYYNHTLPIIIMSTFVFLNLLKKSVFSSLLVVAWMCKGWFPTLMSRCNGNCTADCSDLAIQIQNSETKIYIASFLQVAQLQSHLKGGYVNFGFAVLGFMLQDHCNLLGHQVSNGW